MWIIWLLSSTQEEKNNSFTVQCDNDPTLKKNWEASFAYEEELKSAIYDILFSFCLKRV